MLSDEYVPYAEQVDIVAYRDRITAGAVRSTDAEKRELAKTSHGFNISSKKFRVGSSFIATHAQTTRIS